MASKCFKSIYRFLTLVMICVMSNSGTVLADQNPNLELKEAVKIAVDDNPQEPTAHQYLFAVFAQC